MSKDKNNKTQQLDAWLNEEEKKEITTEQTKDQHQEITSFDNMGLPDNVLRGIYSYGFQNPSRIQSLAIKPIIDGRDLVAQSQSGTGKTGAFTIGTLGRIDENSNYPQAIIMCNTHELSSQIHSVITELAKYMKINISLCIGGIPVTKNAQQAATSQILICTPGRIKDLITRNAFDVNKIKLFVIDEADELLTKEFFEQTRSIVQLIPKETQICIFSATLPTEVLEMTKEFMNNPMELLIRKEKLTLDLITQFYVDAETEDNKLAILEELYTKLSINQCIIYVNNIKKAEYLKDFLKENKHEVETIHSGLSNTERMDIMKRFRNSKFRVLISTDMTSRGIDVQQVSYVINYDIPFDVSAYLHRIGRSGRYGKKGVSINFLTKRDYHAMRKIERYYNIKIEAMPEPEFLNNYLSAL